MLRPPFSTIACFLLLTLPRLTAAASQTTVAVAPFAATDATPPWVGIAIADALSQRIHHQPSLNGLTLRQVNAALRQVRLEPKALADTQAASTLGTQLGADYIVVGDYSTKDERLAASIRVVDTAALKLVAWERYAMPLSELVALEARLATVIGRALGAKEAKALPGAWGTTSLKAWESTTRALMVLRRQSWSPRAADPNAPLALSPEELQEARKLLESATQLDPDFGRAWAALAMAEALTGEADAAWKTLREATAKGAGDDPITILGGAFIRMRQGQYEAAAKILEAAVARHPGFLHARGTLGQLYVHFGRFRESRAVFRAYAEIAPRQPWVLVQIGYANARLGKRDQAIKDTQRALEILPDSPYLLVELASRYIDAKKLTPAQETLERVAKLTPDDARVFVRLGYVHLLRGDDDGAIANATKALKNATSPRQRRDRAYAHLNLARAYGHKGDLDRALEHVKEAKNNGLRSLGEIVNDPSLEKLKQDPRFAGLN